MGKLLFIALMFFSCLHARASLLIPTAARVPSTPPESVPSWAEQEPKPYLRCEKKWGGITFQGKRFQRYKLRAEHFPEGKRFFLVVKWFNGEEAETFSYIANRKGHLILEDKKKDDPLFALCPLKSGEKLEFLMRSQDCPSYCATTSIVPFPLTFKTRGGLACTLELRGQNGEAFNVRGTGFYPEETFELLSFFQGEEQSYSLTSSKEGTIDFLLKLKMNDGEGGECLLTIKRAQEDPEFSFQAGEAALDLTGGCVLEIR